MSAVVCGKRSFYEDLQSPSPPSATPPSAKKLRCSGRYYTPPPQASFADQLKAAFPEMENELIEKTLEECDYDLDSAIKRMNELRLGIANGHVKNDGTSAAAEEALQSQEDLKQRNLPSDGAQWVELFVNEMMSASSIDDAKCRATRVLESLEKSISAQSAEATQNLQKENMMLKEQIEAVMRDNSILKRAFAIQHERQKEYDTKNEEVKIMKDMLAQYQEQLRNLEMNNYRLQMHLKQADQEGNSMMPGRFNPDVF